MLLKKIVIGLFSVIAAIPAMALEMQQQRTVKLSPKIRVSEVANTTMSTQLGNLIKPFLRSDLAVNEPDLKSYPYVVAFTGGRILATKGEKFYVRGSLLPTIPGYAVVRTGDPYVDPDTKEILGYAANYIANADVQKLGDPSTLMVTNAAAAVTIGDRLVPATESTVNLSFAPRLSAAKISGRIIAILGDGNSFTQAGKYTAVVINKGAREGVKLGDMLTISTPGAMVSDWIDDKKKPLKLPNEKVGELIVFKVYDRLSFALVTDASSNIRVKDFVGNA